MFEGTVRYEIPNPGATDPVVLGSQAMWREFMGPHFYTADLSSKTPRFCSFERGRDQVDGYAALGGDTWAVISFLGGPPLQSTVRRVAFDQLPTYSEQAAVTVPDRFSFAYGIEGRLLAGTCSGQARLMEVHEDGTLTPLASGHIRSTVTARVVLPDGREGLLWDGDVHVLNSDRLELAWKLGFGAEPFFRGHGDPYAEAVVPFDEGLLFLDASRGRPSGGTVVRVRPGHEPERLYALKPCEGMLALPEGALLVVPKSTKTTYARVYFLAERNYVNISPKALGLKLPPGDLFWDQTHQRLCVLGGGGMITVPWDAIKAARRQKMS